MFARLFPFVLLDAVSYLAGLIRLRPSLFAVATLLGMIPMTFLFAHLGGAMTAGEEPMRILNLLAVLSQFGREGPASRRRGVRSPLQPMNAGELHGGCGSAPDREASALFPKNTDQDPVHYLYLDRTEGWS